MRLERLEYFEGEINRFEKKKICLFSKIDVSNNKKKI